MSDTVVEILRLLTEHFGQDFERYAQSLAEKRMLERANELRLPDLASYCLFLHENATEPPFLARMLRIRFSSFFRDPLQFELLGSAVVPSMLRNIKNGFFRAWSAACAGGEEACSLAIVIDEALQLLDLKTRVQIFATDVAEDALAEAEYGRYSPGAVAGVTLGRLNKYFIYDRSGYQISPRLKEMITYSRHDLLDPNTYAPPESLFGGFDLVSCRNFLMYLDPQGYLRVFDNLFRALNPEGVLLLGKAETVPERYEPFLERIFDCGNLFRKRQMIRRS